ncbi:MAG: hypothetical protein E6G62_04730 [Actinobacteria bacterium]|nr:MAG: hypothetical protein E6G62_04730 [Actinomycetota bacterium]
MPLRWRDGPRRLRRTHDRAGKRHRPRPAARARGARRARRARARRLRARARRHRRRRGRAGSCATDARVGARRLAAHGSASPS